MAAIDNENIIYLESIESTNNYAIEILLPQKPVEGTIILAKEQTKGRGHGDNYWESEAGKNLTFSQILYPNFIIPEHQFLISKVVCLGLTDFLNKHINNVKIKWPNDIYYYDLKIAGILIENSIMANKILHSVVGIGININQDNFVSKAPNPVSLKQITNKTYDTLILLKDLQQHLDSRYLQLKKNEVANINDDYINLLYKYKTKATFLYQNKLLKGRITGINDHGKLIIDSGNKLHEFGFKEIQFLNSDKIS